MMLMTMRVLSTRTIIVIIRLAGGDHSDPNLKDHDDHLQVLEDPGT